MRGLLGGLVGAAASTATWLAAEHFQQANYGWMVCLVGLVTGVCVNKASAMTTSGFARGALAIILTLAAILGGRQVYARIMQANSTGAQAAPIQMRAAAPAEEKEAEAENEEPTESEDQESAESSSEESAEAEDEEATEPVDAQAEVAERAQVGSMTDEELAGLANSNYSKTAMKNNLQNSDMLWICVAALAAYLTGKGSDPAPVPEAGSEGTTPPEQPAESSAADEGDA